MLRRLLITFLVLATAAACGGTTTANAVGGSTSPPPVVSGNTVAFKVTEYSIAPATLTLKPGTYTFRVTNVGQFPHDLHVAASSDGAEMGGSTIVAANGSTSFTVTLKPGAYTTWCAVDSHRSLGMQGTITVQ